MGLEFGMGMGVDGGLAVGEKWLQKTLGRTCSWWNTKMHIC